MKKQMGAFGLGFFLAFAGISFAAKEPSKISAYAGNYNGTVSLTGSGLAYVGTTDGKFSASKKKKNGALNLTSFISSGSDSGVLTESFNFRNRTLFYTFNLAGNGGSGVGTVNVAKNVISYSVNFSLFSLTYTVQGTIRRTKRGLQISEILSASSGSAQINYTLKRRGK